MAKRYRKYGFINIIRLIVLILLLLLAVFTLCLTTYTQIKDGNHRAAQMRADYVADQRRLIKFEVDRVVKQIDFEVNKHLNTAKELAKQRVNEAYSIAENIYEQNKATKTTEDIQHIIIDALRPVRFDNGDGYYFIISYDGTLKLTAESPEIENTNMLESTDSRGRRLVKDMIQLARSNNEGFYSYYWSKPDSDGNDHQKVSYVKNFAPFNWIIGTYLSAVEKSMQEIITQYITENRFGPKGRGYVFINELLDINGGKKFARVYANPNRPNDTGKVISDDFKDAKGKMFRKEFLKGLQNTGECFVDYWYRKIDNPAPSPKTSYFKLAAKGRFIVAAGLYTDDIESTITAMQATMKNRLLQNLFIISAIFLFIYVVSLFIFNRLSKTFENDFHHFVAFFKKAAQSSELIDHNDLRFEEFDQLAGYANEMLASKVSIEEELDQEKTRLLTTLHSIADGVVTTDTADNILLLNKVAEELTGWNQKKAQGRNISDVIDIETIEYGVRKNYTDYFSANSGAQDFCLTSRSGVESRVSMNSAPIYAEDGVVGNVVVLRDETEKLKTEEELFKAQKLESIGLLAGGIAHDFNNILSGIFGNIELANIKVKNDTQIKPHLQIALDSLQRAKSLTTQLLTFSKGGEPMTEIVNLETMLKDVVPFNLSGSSIVPEYMVSSDLWHVLADRGQISQVISNLIINAKHAMPAGGTLTVTARNIPAESSEIETDSVQLLIRDNGTGMPPDVLQKIFDPYYTTKTDGSGLGLSMVYSIIDKHNGTISVDSAPGKGTTFSIFLAAQGAKQKPSPLSTGEKKGDAVPNNLRILVIEDDPVVCGVLTDLLQAKGYIIDVAAEGAAGVAMYQESIDRDRPYQLVISDLTIPGGMGGKEAVKKILQLHPDAKVIATSGYAMDPIMAQYQKYGFTGRIAKPFRAQDIENEIIRVFNL